MHANFNFSNRQLKIAGLSTLLAGIFGAMAWTFMGEEVQLQLLDGDYQDKCYSYDESSDLKAAEAFRNSDNVLSLIKKFTIAGVQGAQSLKNEGYAFCYDINDDSVQPIERWDRLEILFSESSYPAELFAKFAHAPIQQSYWNSHVTTPHEINQYTFKSGLLFSRIYRAAQIANDLADLMEISDPSYNSINREPWATYLAEHPELGPTVQTLFDNYSGGAYFGDALKIAMDTYLRDGQALEQGDIEYLGAYIEHVKILHESSHEYIYSGPKWGNYAIVDADRDGIKDDVIYMGYGHTAKDVLYDAKKSLGWRLSHKQEDYDCGTTDKPDTCLRDVEEFVYYDVVPAADTATLDLHPETIVKIGELSLLSLWDEQDAQQIISDPAYLSAGSEEVASLMAQVLKEINTNIPGRDNGISAPDLGLKGHE